MTKPEKFCDDCIFIEYARVEDTNEYLSLCSKGYRRCTEERSAIFKDACGPRAKNYVKDTVRK